ncbi:MAG: hydroxyectoine utilization dehydratase EutB [Gammaproteobacteria bacterium]|nr:hydroxyectoine utilization dehydratase EutB [Gammaproteobacteria bacterium]
MTAHTGNSYARPGEQDDPVAWADIKRASERISPWVKKTPLVKSAALSRLSGASVYLKLETVHATGAFKLRGAANCILSLTEEQRDRGVVTVSTGNHGRAVAYIAGRLNVPAVICMSELVPENKLEAVRAAGAEVRIAGSSQDEAQLEAERLVRENGMTLIHPFDDPAIIAGQGTIGAELLDDLERVDTVLAGLSGGGLISGIAVAVKSRQPDARIIGLSPERGPAMYESIRAGRPVAVAEEATLADSLGGGIGLDNRYTFDLVRKYVDDYVLLDDVQIADGIRHLYYHERLVAEGAGAVGVAALLAGLVGELRGNIVCVISGNNIDMGEFTRLVTDEEQDN